jgi:general secretion pathway protein G
MTSIPLDPWKNPYQYEAPTDERAFRIYSLGKDGQPGGWGQNADIENADVARTSR